MRSRRTLLFRLVPLDPRGAALRGDVVAALAPYAPRPELVRRTAAGGLACTCSTFWRTGACPHCEALAAHDARTTPPQDTTTEGDDR